MAAPTSAPNAAFSATLRVEVATANDGAVLGAAATALTKVLCAVLPEPWPSL